jgi:hypothetical protein
MWGSRLAFAVNPPSKPTRPASAANPNITINTNININGINGDDSRASYPERPEVYSAEG